MKMSNY